MKPKLIFKERDIAVWQEEYGYRVERGYEYSFTVSVKPVLEYDSLNEEMNNYIQEKELKIRDDVEYAEKDFDDDEEAEKDNYGFWEPGTEGF